MGSFVSLFSVFSTNQVVCILLIKQPVPIWVKVQCRSTGWSCRPSAGRCLHPSRTTLRKLWPIVRILKKKHLLHRLVKKVLIQSRQTIEIWYALPNSQRFANCNFWLPKCAGLLTATLSRRSGSGSSISPRLAITPPQWPPTASRKSRSPSGPKGRSKTPTSAPSSYEHPPAEW